MDADKSLIETPALRSEDSLESSMAQEAKFYQDYLFYLTFRPAIWESSAVKNFRRAYGLPTSRKVKQRKMTS